GLRWEDVRFDLSYRVTPRSLNGDWRMPYFGNVTLSADLVHRRHLAVYLAVDAIEQGALGSAQVTEYFTRRLGAYVGFFAGRGILYIDTTQPQFRAGGVLGLSVWHSRHFGASFSYSATWTSDLPAATVSTSGLGGIVEHQFSLQFRSRLR